MNVSVVRTHKILPGKETIYDVLDAGLVGLHEGSIVVVTSKIVSICEGRVADVGSTDKQALVSDEAQLVLPEKYYRYGLLLTIKRNILIPNAGIDESNGNGKFILWPSDPQKTANGIRSYLRKRFSLHRVGVIISDSKTTPLRWGTTGVAIAHSGFAALNTYIGKRDIFGRELQVTKANVMDALAASAVLVMGEGNEQTPLAIMTDIPFVRFQARNPTKAELQALAISLEDDLYAPILTQVPWRKGGEKSI